MHGTTLGSVYEDEMRRVIETLVSWFNFVMLNKSGLTDISPSSANISCLDLAMRSPISAHFTWSLHDDLCGSDNFPLSLCSQLSVTKSVNQSVSWNRPTGPFSDNVSTSLRLLSPKYILWQMNSHISSWGIPNNLFPCCLPNHVVFLSHGWRRNVEMLCSEKFQTAACWGKSYRL